MKVPAVEAGVEGRSTVEDRQPRNSYPPPTKSLSEDSLLVKCLPIGERFKWKMFLPGGLLVKKICGMDK